MPSNIPAMPRAISQSEWREALAKWLDGFRFTHAVTLVWNRSVGLDRARADLRDLLHRVDRQLLGSNFNRVPSRFRTTALFAFEGHGHDHVHVHSLWRAPADRWFQLGKLFPSHRGGVWNEVVESGSYDVEPCNMIGGNSEIIGYMLKQQHLSAEPHMMIWSDEFHPSRR